MLVQPIVLELTVVHLAYAGAMQVLAGEVGKLVRVRARGWASVAIACQRKLAQLVNLDCLLSLFTTLGIIIARYCGL